MRVPISWIAAIFVTVVSNALWASPFDTCVLQHMQATKSDLAAVAVKESCIRTVEVPLPASAIQALLMNARAIYGKLPFGYSGDGLYISLNNNSGYTITELVIAVFGKKTNSTERYVVRRFPFPPPPNFTPTGPPPDKTVEEMIRPGLRQFFTAINPIFTGADWAKDYGWNFISAKGFLEN